MGRGRTVLVGIAEYYLRPNLVFFVFFKVNEMF